MALRRRSYLPPLRGWLGRGHQRGSELLVEGETPLIAMVLPDENRRLSTSTAETYELTCASVIAAGSYAIHTGSSLVSVEWWEQRPLPPAHTSVAPSEHHRSLPVVPLIRDKRYYGEAPGRPAGRSGAGLEEQGARGSTVWGALRVAFTPKQVVHHLNTLVCPTHTSCIQYACPWLCPAFTLAVPSGLPPN